MAEYAGYVQRAAPIDWGMVAEDIITKLGDVEKDKAAFREKYDTMASDLYKELGDYEAGKSQSFNEFVYNGISSGRTTLAALHEKLKRREISPDDFNRATMSMSSQMDDFKKLTTHYNEVIANTQQGIDDKKLSGLSVFASERLASIADFKNKNLQWMPTQSGYTNLYINPVDENGNITGEPISVTSLVTPGNLEYKRTNVVEEAKTFTSQLGEFQKGRIYDATAREKYKEARTGIVNSIVNDANSVASILSEYGGYTFYEEGQPKPEGKSLMVKVDDNHMLVPDVNYENHDDPAVKEAREIVENIINQQVSYRETPAPSSKPPQDKPKYKPEDLLAMQTAYNITGEMANGNFTNANNDYYLFGPDGEGTPNADGSITIYSKKDKTKGGQAKKVVTIKAENVEDAKSFAPYTGQFTSGKEIIEWDYINSQTSDKIKINPTQTTSDFSLDINDENISSTITSITQENTDKPENLITVKNNIKKLISSKIPTLSESITFGEIKIGSFTNEIPILVNGEILKDENGNELTIITDVTVDTGDSKRNKKVIDAAINAAIGSGIDYSNK